MPGRTTRATRARGELEREVLACLAAADHPLTVHDVVAELPNDLAYTTVMTILSRLHTKNAIAREPAGRAFVYSLPDGPQAAEASMTAHRMHRLLEDGNDRSVVLSRFVAELNPGDEELLRSLLAGDPPTGERAQGRP